MQVPPESRQMLRRQLGTRLEAEGLPLLGAIPYDPLLTSIRLDEIRACLGADIIFGQNMIDIEVDQVGPSRCSHLISLGGWNYVIYIYIYHPVLFLKICPSLPPPSVHLFPLPRMWSVVSWV